MSQTIVALLVALVASALPHHAAPTSIRGRVTALDSGQPIARAIVKLRFLGPGVPKWEATTDDEGRYAFANLPAGGFALHAEQPAGTSTYVSRRYGQSVRFDPLRHDPIVSPIRLSEGAELIAPIELPRALSINGRVVSAGGEPIRNIRVSLRDGNGNVAMLRDAITDVDGRFTVAGVRPGDYRLCAVPYANFALIRTEGRFESEQPFESCNADKPTTVSTTGLSDVEITVRSGLVYSVSGAVVDASGAPLESNTFQFKRQDGRDLAAIDTKRSGNQFVVRGVPPGEYLLTARRIAADGRTIELGSASVRVNTADIEGVVLRTAMSVSIVGRIEFDEGVPGPLPKVNVNTIGQRSRPPGPFENVSHMRGDLTFQLDGLLGPQMLQVFGAMKPWTVKAIRYRGEDIYGKSLEFRANTNPDDLVVVLTNRSASVTAKLREGSGHASSGATVALIPLDPRTSAPLENAAFRPIDFEGPFGLPIVRPGDYLIAAVAPEDAYGPSSSVVSRLAGVAQRITLAPGEHRVIELDLVRPK